MNKFLYMPNSADPCLSLKIFVLKHFVGRFCNFTCGLNRTMVQNHFMMKICLLLHHLTLKMNSKWCMHTKMDYAKFYRAMGFYLNWNCFTAIQNPYKMLAHKTVKPFFLRCSVQFFFLVSSKWLVSFPFHRNVNIISLVKYEKCSPFQLSIFSSLQSHKTNRDWVTQTRSSGRNRNSISVEFES